MSALGLAVGATRTWVRLYTHGLRPGLCEARRAELESDLWEHTRAAGEGPSATTAFEIAARLVVGIPADLSWRVKSGTKRHRTAQRSGTMLSKVKKHGMVALTGALGVWYLFIGITAPLSAYWEGDTAGKVASVTLCGLAGTVVIAGLVGRRNSKRWASPALAVGAVLGAVFMFWIVVPVVVALAVLVWLFVTRERGAPAPA